MRRGATKAAGLAVALLAAVALAACGDDAPHSTASAESVETGPLKVIPRSAATYRDGSRHYATEWAKEADRAKLEAAAKAAHDYFVARAEKDWETACDRISEILEQRIKERSPRFANKECTELLVAASKPLGDSTYKSSQVLAESLRSDGVWAFLLYRSGDERHFMSMVKELDGWKVNLLEPQDFEG